MIVIQCILDLKNLLLIAGYKQMVRTILALDLDFNPSSIMISLYDLSKLPP